MKRITLGGGISTVEASAINMGKAEIRQFIRKIDSILDSVDEQQRFHRHGAS
jgi:hypothetical protein